MSLEEKCSYIRIAGIYLSKEEGAVYGWANIHADEIFCEDNIAGQQIVQTINNAVYYNDFVEKKNRRSKKESYLNYKIIK